MSLQRGPRTGHEYFWRFAFGRLVGRIGSLLLGGQSRQRWNSSRILPGVNRRHAFGDSKCVFPPKDECWTGGRSRRPNSHSTHHVLWPDPFAESQRGREPQSAIKGSTQRDAATDRGTTISPSAKSPVPTLPQLRVHSRQTRNPREHSPSGLHYLQTQFELGSFW
jgi:hypothetical protein